MNLYAKRISVCHRCPRRKWEGANRLLCSVNQKDIVENAKSDCPAARFDLLEFDENTPAHLVARAVDGESPLPDGWQQWPNVQQAYRDALASAAKSIPQPPDPSGPNRFSGRGTVLVGMGSYFASAYCSIRLARRVGDQTPIELWGLPEEKIEPWQQKALASLNVAVRFPGADFGIGSRAGWRLKSYAILHSSFEEVRFSDADSYPVADPAYFWNSEEFNYAGAIYFPDRSFQKHDIQKPTYKVLGISPPLYEPSFESGQFFIDKRRCWPAVWLANWLSCTHSEYYYNVSPDLYGDKDLFRLAHRLTGTRFAIPPYIDYRSPAFVHFGFDGKPRFVHRVNGKLATREVHYDTTHQVDYRRNDELPMEADAWEILNELAKLDPESGKPITAAAKIARGVMGIAKAITGTGGADQATIDAREAICGGCEHAVTRLGILSQCSLCGCATDAKIRNAGESCPVGKWTAVSGKPRYALLTYYDDAIAGWAHGTAKLMGDYARKHGYRFVPPTPPMDAKLPANWQRVPLLLKHLPECEFAVWLDADVIITNPDFELSAITVLSKTADLFITRDHDGINNGVMVWRNTKASRDFLAKWRTAFAPGDCDQKTMKILLRVDRNALKVHEVPQRTMNAYIGNHQPGDWLLHYAGIEDKAEAIPRHIRNMR